ncbi:hypothetical protein LIER_30455 [Lithospermum erythrorhizon]|uniref:RNase H type-1 domain-containing protein n=1 Tax=Lithospermum erythrorhizon TaxID=34254 RepID=A0AAV3RR01_LITER
MLVQRKKQEEHLDTLEETLMKLRQSQLRINPEKCLFWVTLGNFLGFMVHISVLGYESTLFRKLRQVSRQEFIWDEECSKAFEELKAYLESPKILTRPKGKEELQLYLVVSKGTAQPLADFVMECTTRNPPEDTENEPTPPERPLWTLYMDGASNPKGEGAGILIQGLEESSFEHALRFQFQATNNEVEYEALVMGLLLAQSLGISRIVVKGDSKLAIKQIRGDCRVKNESLQ